jgi:uncharacterized protein involved in type VI secretion and phage assembly
VKQKREVLGKAKIDNDSAPELTDGSLKPSSTASKFGAAEYRIIDAFASTSGEADALAAAAAADLASVFAEAEGVALGDPGIRAGVKVTIKKSGKQFDGKWRVTYCQHVFSGQDGYLTHFEASGRSDRSLLGLATVGATTEASRTPPIHGCVIGVVTNTKDPDAMGRVKLKFPWLADDYESHWARIAFPGAGKERGFFWIPEVADEVLVAFEHGDTRRPFVLGGLYNGKDKSPEQPEGQLHERRTMKSKSGAFLQFNDKSGKEAITLQTKGGEIKILLDQTANTLEISTKKDVKITADNDITIEAKKNITMKAGSNIDIKAQAGLTAEATGQLQVKGSTVTVQGSGPTAVKGSPLQLN